MTWLLLIPIALSVCGMFAMAASTIDHGNARNREAAWVCAAATVAYALIALALFTILVRA